MKSKVGKANALKPNKLFGKWKLSLREETGCAPGRCLLVTVWSDGRDSILTVSEIGVKVMGRNVWVAIS